MNSSIIRFVSLKVLQAHQLPLFVVKYYLSAIVNGSNATNLSILGQSNFVKKALVLILKLLKVLFIPHVILQRIALLILLQFLYEVTGYMWKKVRSNMYILNTSKGKILKLRRDELERASTYEQWHNASKQLNELIFENQEITSEERVLVNKLESRTAKYEKFLKRPIVDDSQSLRRLIRQDLLQKETFFPRKEVTPRVKKAFDDYQDCLLRALNRIVIVLPAYFSSPVTLKSQLSELNELRERLTFLREVQSSFGNSALLLSGGATLGLLHVGVVESLMQQGLLPKVLSGSSAGSIVCALVCTSSDHELKKRLFMGKDLNLKFFGRNDSLADDLDKLILTSKTEKQGEGSENVNAFEVLKRLLPKYLDSKTLLEGDVLAKALRDMMGDITFQEAFEKTRRVLNISVTPHGDEVEELPQLLNYQTSPNVVIWSAVVASCSIPGVFAPQKIFRKNSKGVLKEVGGRWVDGSLEMDLPLRKVEEMFNVNNFIVSQVNPHARFLAPHKDLDFYGFMPDTLASFSQQFWGTYGSVLMFLRDQIRSYMKHFRSFLLHPKNLLLRSFTHKLLLPLFTQKYHGDITLTPSLRAEDLKNLLVNPTRETFLKAKKRGKKMTWPHISSIRRRCAVEFMIKDCIKSLDYRRKALESKLFENDEQDEGMVGYLDSTDSSVALERNLYGKLKQRAVSVLQMEEEEVEGDSLSFYDMSEESNSHPITF